MDAATCSCVFGFLSNIEFAWMYPSLASFLTRLASFSRLILMDRRGSGLSDRFEDAPPAETMLRDLEVVLDEVGSPKTTLFGLWDGRCDPRSSSRRRIPERVSSLVLFTVSAAQKPADDYPWAWDESVLGGVAREHPTRMGNPRVGREERTLDGTVDAR